MSESLVYLINGLTNLVVFIVASYAFVLSQRKHSKLSYFFLVFGMVHLISATMNAFWFFRFMSYVPNDAFILSSIFVAIKAALLISMLYYMTEEKNGRFLRRYQKRFSNTPPPSCTMEHGFC